jgi:Methyltransferase domain
MDLQALLDDPPSIHEYKGKLIVWGLLRPILDFIDGHVNDRSKTLETGSGLSTILFALKGGSHLCITPSQVEVDRIRDYCKQHGVSLQNVDFRVDLSENVLPELGADELDLALIDGGHGFPTPFMDWYFISSKLKTGGILIVDDIGIWTGRILKEFLISEPEWKLIEPFTEKTAIFVKEQSYRPSKEWVEQPYVVKRSEPLERHESKFRRGLRLLRRGRILTLVRKAAKEMKI